MKTTALWVMLHSGSRNIGNRMGTYFIERAKKAMGDKKLVDKDLAWLSEGTRGLRRLRRTVSAGRRTMPSTTAS